MMSATRRASTLPYHSAGLFKGMLRAAEPFGGISFEVRPADFNSACRKARSACIWRTRLGSLARRWKRGRGRRFAVDGIDLHHLHARPVRVEQAHLPLVVHAHVDLQ